MDINGRARCKICGKQWRLNDTLMLRGRDGWFHNGCVFEAWLDAKKTLDFMMSEDDIQLQRLFEPQRSEK